MEMNALKTFCWQAGGIEDLYRAAMLLDWNNNNNQDKFSSVFRKVTLSLIHWLVFCIFFLSFLMQLGGGREQFLVIFEIKAFDLSVFWFQIEKRNKKNTPKKLKIFFITCNNPWGGENGWVSKFTWQCKFYWADKENLNWWRILKCSENMFAFSIEVFLLTKFYWIMNQIFHFGWFWKEKPPLSDPWHC